MKIVVLYGGVSTERNISLISGTMVCNALREKGHKAILVDVFFGMERIEADPGTDLFEQMPPVKEVQFEDQEPDLAKIRSERLDKSPSIFGPGVLDLCKKADMVFIALHGELGEDGRIQAAFDLMGIPYTGSGYRGSAIAMDKSLTKVILKANGILTPRWRSFNLNQQDLNEIADDLHLPCVIKIPRGGSSIGVSIVHTREEAYQALLDDKKYDTTVIVEEYIKGREFTAAVLDGQALPSVEIIPKKGFYDYSNKYKADATEEICPSDVPPEIEDELRNTALSAHRVLGLGAYSRSDFMMNEEGRIYCLEVNTLPGMTPTSLVPREAKAVGISFPELCERIIKASMKES